ncbi:bifunctional hydroxymethylpyrimidine kinase/phosphomethylpyrimidine kinase [Spirulina major CS-329]|uniref:bifunctional hydroxymethylpyrimidine kinase/phosphomethylpyrimidine kinase n=1 Tax=Spirulina TaxID=1154 RepID=UPI00232C69C1|nr:MULTISPECIES: bifunctional hydroxymethylpyrimidine kinase/phosphomethylpyrimidine kinase [Spirulina]MDB9495842.1 bifunctional hydroxymethylpyrimidine kinase/phosphomethylpyrimidine kinase [Spirulina subsalsa CS-330]MDB9504654.1 bifunctional hydroxymethylpyrimidine kinase/phosphomethylpyrimidine kinase [Spirulina major CS-329]
MTIPTVLTIAGSDSGGGAGIQADLRTLAMHCVHGMTAITCVTAQNTMGVNRVDALPPEAVVAQIDAVRSDIGITAAKTGMLLNGEIMTAVAAVLRAHPIANLVVDPVMVSRAGVQLIEDGAIAILREQIFPHAVLITPNRYEAQILAQMEIHDPDTMQAAAQGIYQDSHVPVLLKGGGFTNALRGVDLWYDGQEWDWLPGPAVATPHTHGTGCTLSAAIAANLALGHDRLTSVRRAKQYVTQALHHGLAIGQGTGPVGHFYPLLTAPASPAS